MPTMVRYPERLRCIFLDVYLQASVLEQLHYLLMKDRP